MSLGNSVEKVYRVEFLVQVELVSLVLLRCQVVMEGVEFQIDRDNWVERACWEFQVEKACRAVMVCWADLVQVHW